MQKSLKTLFFTILMSLWAVSPGHAQYEIKPVSGYSPQIGIMVDMLEELKARVESEVRGLSPEQTDFLFDKNANTVGALIMHLIATEVYYQVETLEERQLTEEESKRWEAAFALGDKGRAAFKGKPIQHYLDLWDEVREKSLAGLKRKDDAWFDAAVGEEEINNYWVWFHVMEHIANHLGQISLVKNRLPK